MLIAVTAKSNDPESEVDPRFGRAQCFHLIEKEPQIPRMFNHIGDKQHRKEL